MKASHQIKNCVVIGAGDMGAQIALWLSQFGYAVTLADMPATDGSPLGRVEAGLAKARPICPGTDAALMGISQASFTVAEGVCAPDATLTEALKTADLVVEAVIEKLEAKQGVFRMVAEHVRKDTWIATNSSGLNLNNIAEALPENLRRQFFGLHFFNPVFAQVLLEVIACDHTDAELFAEVQTFARSHLGKGVVVARNAANYAGNVLGVWLMQWLLWHFRDFDGMTIAGADAVCRLLGLMKPFVVMGFVKLALEKEVAQTSYDGLPTMPYRDEHLMPDWVEALLTAGHNSVYQNRGKVVVDPTTGEFGQTAKPEFASLTAALAEKGGAAMKALLSGEDAAAQLAREVVVRRIMFAAWCVGISCDTTYGMDDAAELGFSHKTGPFRMADMLAKLMGPKWVLEQAQAMKIDHIPAWYEAMVETGHTFYRVEDGTAQWFNPLAETPGYEGMPEYDGEVTCAQLIAEAKIDADETGKILHEQEELTVVTVSGKPVIAACMHSGPMNTLTSSLLSGLIRALELAEERNYALVIATDGRAFSAGAHLPELLGYSESGDEAAMRKMIAVFKGLVIRIRTSRVPVVAAVHGMALGGGCELMMACDRVVASYQTSIGLVEPGVGLIPGAGGVVMLLERCMQSIPVQPSPQIGRLVGMRQDATMHAFATIGWILKSANAPQAMDMLFLRPGDVITPGHNPRLTLNAAIDEAIGMQGHFTPRPLPIFKVTGRDQCGAIHDLAVAVVRSNGFSHMEPICKALGDVLTGGDVRYGTVLTLAQMFQAETDAFVRVAMGPLAQGAIKAFLGKGK